MGATIPPHIPTPSTEGDVRELRLALVCYGGVSLAIYMHGVTKELHKLVRASVTPNQTENPFPEHTSEHVYWDLLRRVQATSGVRLRVIVDIIAGTSAGGINGICLAKALALNESQDALKDLWFSKGDINKLAAGISWVPAWLKTFELVGRSAIGLGLDAPLRGDEMCRWLHQAFEDMDSARREHDEPATLVPPDHLLELYVTVTDLRGYTRELPIADPGIIKDLTHRHVLVFRHSSQGESGFSRAHNHALAFSARATSSFPGAFPPLTFTDYCGYFTPAANLRPMALEQFAVYTINDADPRNSAFVDGGVLDNAPFDHVLRAIRQRPAAAQVDRRLLYIEPDPAAAEPSPPSQSLKEDRPGWVKTILSALSSVPATQPILDDLNALAERNRVVRRIRDVIETNFAPIKDRIEGLTAKHGLSLITLSADAPRDTLRALRAEITAAAAASAGFAYPSYVRLRLGYVLDGYAALIAQALNYPIDSYPARFVETIVRDWARVEELEVNTPQRVPDQTAFLDATDLAYHERRLRFVIAAFSWWYRVLESRTRPTRQELDVAKATMYRHIAALSEVIAKLVNSPEGHNAFTHAFPVTEVKTAARDQKAAEFLERHRSHLNILRGMVQTAVTRHVAVLETEVYDDLVRLTAGWPADMRADLFARYLSFPFWDIVVYPIAVLANVDERDHTDVIRISPLDAKHLGGGADKLMGIGLHHFAAFFKRRYRENDYLWGRLDAAERLVGLLLDDPDTPGLDSPADECRPVFEAILSEESDSLGTVTDLITDLRGRVSRLPHGAR